MKNKFERYGVRIPQIVERTIKLAEKLEFPLLPEGRQIGYTGPASACIPEMGRLLSTLVAGHPNGKIAEFGTGSGVGTAWMTCGLSENAMLYSADIDANLVAHVAKLFTDYPHVVIRHGDFIDVLLSEMPCDLIFVDSGVRHLLVPEKWDWFTEMVKIGGQIVFDDLVPLELWPPEWDDLIDLKREFAFNNPRVVGTAVQTTSTQVAIIVTRLN